MVEAEQKKSTKSETMAETNETVNKDNITTDQEAKPSELAEKASEANGKSEEVGMPGCNKRPREEDEEGGPEAKKVDTKADTADAVSGQG